MVRFILTAFAAAVALIFTVVSLPAQEEGTGNGKAKKAPTGPAPKLHDGKPDFSGIWSPDRNFIYDMTDAMKKGDEFPIQPWALKLAKDRQSEEDPEALCLPTGVPRLAPYPWSIVQGPKHIYIVFEGNIHSYRQIFMDNRKHSADPNPSWYGESIGHYEGDTLVIDTIGFNDRSWLDQDGHPHTEDLHVIERYTRTDEQTLRYEVTIDDPKTYSKPWTSAYTIPWHEGSELMEYVCQENNKDVLHMVGK